MAKATKSDQKKPLSIRNQADYEFAYLLFMQKVPLKEIATRCNISPNTLTAWKEKGEWEIKRAAKTISMDELLTKALQRVNELLNEEEFSADSFAKAVKQLKELKTANTVDDDILCFMKFQDWLIERQSTDKAIDEGFMKNLVRLQDFFIKNRINNAGK